MEFLQYYGRVLAVAFSHSLETAHSFILIALIVLGVVSHWFPGIRIFGVQVTPHHAHAWQTAALVLCAIVIVRLLLSPYWIWQEQQQKLLPPPQPELMWTDTVAVQDAFIGLPKPCVAKLTAARETMNSRNILKRLIMPICEMPDDQRDQQIRIETIDSPRSAPIEGIIVHWDARFEQGARTFAVFRDTFKNVRASNRLPVDSPRHLIWIEVGTGYPWK